MEDCERIELEHLDLAPYIQKATTLIGKGRRVGGNQFRHSMATLAILIDYHFTDSVLLKAAVLHDLFEDAPETDPEEIKTVDDDGVEVVQLAFEVTRRDESKATYLERIRNLGSFRAKVLKVADRISNLTDLHLDTFSLAFVERYVTETEEHILPLAIEVNADMAFEVADLIEKRRQVLAERRGAFVDAE